MTHSVDELLTRLAEHADWCDANEWELPITMGDDIREAIQWIKAHSHNTNQTVSGQTIWKYAGVEMQATETPSVIWECNRCGYRRLAGWTPPYYNCPECTGRKTTTQENEKV